MHCNESEPPHSTCPPIWHRRCIRCDKECNWRDLTGEICVNLLSQVKDRGLMFLWQLISSFPCSDHLKMQWKCEVQSWIIGTLASFVEGARCKLGPRDWFFSLNFMILLVSSMQMLGTILKFGHQHFLSRPYQFIIHKPPCHLTLRSLKLLI